MARIFASSGKRVLVVDFDMHKPKVLKSYIQNEIGNSTNLSRKTSFEKSLNEIENDLFVITGGPVPPNPSELVLSDQTKNLSIMQRKILTSFSLIYQLDILPMR